MKKTKHSYIHIFKTPEGQRLTTFAHTPNEACIPIGYTEAMVGGAGYAHLYLLTVWAYSTHVSGRVPHPKRRLGMQQPDAT